MNSRNHMAASATLHCITGCAIGEIAGLMIGTALSLSTGITIALAVVLAFLFGYALSTLPLIQAGLGFTAALSVVFAADTLSIAVMEIIDNAVMAIIPGAMNSGLVKTSRHREQGSPATPQIGWNYTPLWHRNCALAVRSRRPLLGDAVGH